MNDAKHPDGPEVDGFVVDQRFEAVVALARTSMVSAGGGALCVYLHGVPVVDVWAGSRDASGGLPWEQHTMAMSWSTTKGITSTVLHMLADRGALDYDTPVATYWPEFAVNGKGSGDGSTVHGDGGGPVRRASPDR